jgi:hypothetical protein
MLTIEPDACFGDDTHYVDRTAWVFCVRSWTRPGSYAYAVTAGRVAGRD